MENVEKIDSVLQIANQITASRTFNAKHSTLNLELSTLNLELSTFNFKP